MIRRLQQGWHTAGWLNYLLLPVSGLYRILVQLRHGLFRCRLKAVHEVGVPVVVVGNLSVGGTGKTPVVIALAEYLQSQGMQPGVIARGYGGHSTFWPRLIVSSDSAAEVGDEPLLIYRRTGVPVVVGPQRVRSAQMLVDKCQCDVVISDDGLQHFALARTLDIAVIDGEKQFGNGFCLPAGPLREPLSGIRRAQLAIVNGANEAVRQEIGRRINTAGFNGEVFCYQAVANDLYRLGDDSDTTEIELLAGQPVHAVAGLGNPARFVALLDRHGIKHTDHFFGDHHQFQSADFEFASAGDVIVMTEKDAVKCQSLDIRAEVWVLPIKAQLPAACLQAVADAVNR